ncbi:MAG: rod shape-determining protein MreD [Acidimicrobiia bacterium]|nr:rod shape-determining protein MreD [Acidimicrobiia bacterium]
MSVARLTVTARLAALVALVALVQVSLVAPLRIFGVAPDVVLLVAVAAGVAAGPERGAISGFVVGIAYDLFLQTPLGLTALVCALASYGTGLFQLPLVSHPRSWQAGCVVVASGLGVLGFLVIGVVLGQDELLGVPVLRVATVVALVNGVLALPAVRLLSWVWAPLAPPQRVVL